MILGIDTSIGTAVAVVDLDGTVRADVASPDARGHAEVIGTLIERALAEAGVRPTDIRYVAAGMGPGPFTGLRVGIAAARAFALGRGIPVISVVSHDAAALDRTALDGTGDAPFAIVTDARRREVAFSIYRADTGRESPQRLAGPELALKGTDITAAGMDFPAAEIVETTTISAAALARVAARRIATGESDPAASDPLYLRVPDVTPSNGPKRVGT